jgi:hypothetical protein
MASALGGWPFNYIVRMWLDLVHGAKEGIMRDHPGSVTITSLLVLLSAAAWLALGLVIAINRHPALSVSLPVRAAMVGLSVAAACVLFGLYVLTQIRRPVAYFALLAALGLGSLVVIFDDIGWADLLVLIIHVVPIILLIRDRAWYLERGAAG